MLTFELQRSEFCESGACIMVGLTTAKENASPLLKVVEIDGKVHLTDGNQTLIFDMEEWKAFKLGALAGQFD